MAASQSDLHLADQGIHFGYPLVARFLYQPTVHLTPFVQPGLRLVHRLGSRLLALLGFRLLPTPSNFQAISLGYYLPSRQLLLVQFGHLLKGRVAYRLNLLSVIHSRVDPR